MSIVKAKDKSVEKIKSSETDLHTELAMQTGGKIQTCWINGSRIGWAYTYRKKMEMRLDSHKTYENQFLAN